MKTNTLLNIALIAWIVLTILIWSYPEPVYKLLIPSL